MQGRHDWQEAQLKKTRERKTLVTGRCVSIDASQARAQVKLEERVALAQGVWCEKAPMNLVQWEKSCVQGKVLSNPGCMVYRRKKLRLRREHRERQERRRPYGGEDINRRDR